MSNSIISDQTAASLTPFEPNPDKVLVAFDGKIESILCVRILQDQGFQVETVFFATEEKNEEKAKQAAIKLTIPFSSVLLEELDQYKKNKEKITCTYLEALAELAVDRGFQYIASGHNARVVVLEDRFTIDSGEEINLSHLQKLSSLSQQTLSKLCLPMGEFTMDAIKEIAQALGL